MTHLLCDAAYNMTHLLSDAAYSMTHLLSDAAYNMTHLLSDAAYNMIHMTNFACSIVSLDICPLTDKNYKRFRSRMDILSTILNWL